MSKIRGNKTLSGTWGEVWVDGEKIFELSKVELKITATVCLMCGNTGL